MFKFFSRHNSEEYLILKSISNMLAGMSAFLHAAPRDRCQLVEKIAKHELSTLKKVLTFSNLDETTIFQSNFDQDVALIKLYVRGVEYLISWELSDIFTFGNNTLLGSLNIHQLYAILQDLNNLPADKHVEYLNNVKVR